MEIWVFKPGTRRLGESRILPNAEKEKFADYALSVLRPVVVLDRVPLTRLYSSAFLSNVKMS